MEKLKRTESVLGALPVLLSSRDPVAEGTKRISRVCLPFHPFPLSLLPSLSKRSSYRQGAVKERERGWKRIHGPTHSSVLSRQVLPLTARETKTWCPQSRGGENMGTGNQPPCCLAEQRHERVRLRVQGHALLTHLWRFKMGTTVLLALVRAIQGLRTLLICPKARKPEGRKPRLGCSAPVGQVPGLVTLQAQAFTDSFSMWVQAMGPTVLQKSQQVPTTGSPGPNECPSMTLPSSPYPREKTQFLVGSGELARGDPPRPLEAPGCLSWKPGSRAKLLVKGKHCLCLSAWEQKKMKPASLRPRRLGGPVVRAWSQTAWVQVKSNLLAVFWLCHVDCMIKEVMTLPLNLCPSHHPEHTWSSAQYTVGGQEGLCSFQVLHYLAVRPYPVEHGSSRPSWQGVMVEDGCPAAQAGTSDS